MMRSALLFFVVALATVAFAQQQQQQVLKPDNASDGPLRVFKPTSEFQVVEDDESIPPGLHIRLNLETGQREARLNTPSSNGGDDDSAVENGVIVVKDAVEQSEDTGRKTDAKERLSMLEKSGRAPPEYSNVGKIQPPSDQSGRSTFHTSVAVILSQTPSTDDTKVLQALDELEDLSHDIYYGLEVAKNARLTTALLQLVDSAEGERVRMTPALILGSAVQNSPAALEELRGTHPDLITDILSWLEKEEAPKMQERLIFLLANLVKSAEYMDDFLDARGLDRLLKIYKTDLTNTSSRDGVRRKCVHVITDNFLDVDMRQAETVIEDTSQKEKQATWRADLRTWCKAFEMDLTSDAKVLESDVARETIEAAIRFPACQQLSRSEHST